MSRVVRPKGRPATGQGKTLYIPKELLPEVEDILKKYYRLR
jgi:hypothetical protein